MFNAPRRGTQQLSSSAFISSSSGSSYPDPLAQSTPNVGYGEVDPWSAVPSPARIATPRAESQEVVTTAPANTAGATGAGRAGLNAFFNDPPPLYLSLLDQMDPTSTGQVALATVQRTLSTSKLPAATIEKIVNLTARDRSSLSRHEIFCSLALVALAQSSDNAEDTESGISIEELSTSLPNLPLPRVTVPSPSPQPAFALDSPSVEASSSSPWDTNPRSNGLGNGISSGHVQEASDMSTATNGDDGRPGAFSTGTEKGYWKRLERVDVSLMAEREGWFLQKYKVESDKRGAGVVHRRYSDFVWLLDCLIKRYPFRLLPALPPKKIGPDANFLEQRRKALQRFLNMIVNHPVMRDDGALNVFLTEPGFESWRKRTKVSTDEESSSKSLTKAQEMAIPSDLEEKLGNLRDHLPAMLGSYQKLVLVAERGLARLQASSADASRLALSLETAAQAMPKACYMCVPGGTSCSLCHGVEQGLSTIGEHWSRVAEEHEKQAKATMLVHIENLKTQRDLYLAFRDLFARHDRLSKDTVDALRKKVEVRLKKIETLRSAVKAGWEFEADKLAASNESDNTTINNFLARRIFIRACMWHELAVVFHSRQAAQTTLGWRSWTTDQEEAQKVLGAVWEQLGEQLKSMPVE